MAIRNFCEVCEVKFFSERRSAKYCSNACKQKAKRERAKPDKENEVTLDDVKLFIAKNFNDAYIVGELLGVLGIEPSSAYGDRIFSCRACGQNWYGDHPPTHCHSSECKPNFGKIVSRWDVKEWNR